MTSPSSPSVQVTSVTPAPSAAYLAIVAPVPIDSSSGWACTSSSLWPLSGALMAEPSGDPGQAGSWYPGRAACTGTPASSARLG